MICIDDRLYELDNDYLDCIVEIVVSNHRMHLINIDLTADIEEARNVLLCPEAKA